MQGNQEQVNAQNQPQGFAAGSPVQPGVNGQNGYAQNAPGTPAPQQAGGYPQNGAAYPQNQGGFVPNTAAQANYNTPNAAPRTGYAPNTAAPGPGYAAQQPGYGRGAAYPNGTAPQTGYAPNAAAPRPGYTPNTAAPRPGYTAQPNGYAQNTGYPGYVAPNGTQGGYRQQYAYRRNQATGAAPANGQVPGTQPGTPQNASPNDLQRELERQICAFGSTLTDGFRYGFDGRGNEIGNTAKNMGAAFANVVNYGVNQGLGAMNRAQQNAQAGGYSYTYRYHHGHMRDRDAYHAYRHSYRYGKMPKGPLRSAYGTRFGFGLAQVITGGVFLFCFGIGGLVCLPLGLGLAEMALWITGASLLAACLPFLWMTIHGAHNLKIANHLRAFAAAAGEQESVSISSLATASQRSVADTKKLLRRLLKKGWLTAWLDEGGDMLYLSEQAYSRALEAQEKEQQESAAVAADKQQQEKENETLASMRNFVAVLEQEKTMMQGDPQAVEELDQMAKTSQSIYEWVRQHPDSISKSQRLASYYIPTTLKLLHTYNEVGKDGGDNAESIRRDVSGMLHTLNTAFTNLSNNLLSDVALDVSSEISAMQSMLAQDGLSMNGPELHPQQ